MSYIRKYKYYPEGFSLWIDIIWAGYEVERAIRNVPPIGTSTQVVTQAALSNAISWLQYAKNYSIKGSENYPKWSKQFLKLVHIIGIQIDRLENISNNVPVETDPNFNVYKMTVIYESQGYLGYIQLTVDKLWREMTKYYNDKHKKKYYDTSSSSSSSSESEDDDSDCKKTKSRSHSKSYSRSQTKKFTKSTKKYR